MMRAALISVTAAALSAPAAAQTPEEAAAANLQLAMTLCLQNYRDPDAMVPAYREAGFDLTAGLDAGTHDLEAPGLWGVIVPKDDQSYCTFQAAEVPFETGRAIGNGLAEAMFPGKVEDGHPEGRPTECPMISIFAPRRMMVMEFYNPGNGGTCDSPEGAAIVIR